MSSLPGLLRAQHKQPRANRDWYLEPDHAVCSLFDRVRFKGPIFDPAVGQGMIPTIAREYGYEAAGNG